MTSRANGAALSAPAARLDLGSAALNLARQAADKRRSRKAPLTRREALAEAPWVEGMPVDRRAFAAAYADRLVELGIALPSTEGSSGPSGPSGKNAHPLLNVRIPKLDQDRYREAAAHYGMTLSAWVRRELDHGARNALAAKR